MFSAQLLSAARWRVEGERENASQQGKKGVGGVAINGLRCMCLSWLACFCFTVAHRLGRQQESRVAALKEHQRFKEHESYKD